MDEPLLSVTGLVKRFTKRGQPPVVAVNDVSFTVAPGEVLGLVGESGSGKSTTARCVVRLALPDEGHITYDGIDVRQAKGADLKRLHREIGMVFQDPYSSLNPRMTVAELVGEGLLVHGLEPARDARRQRAAEILDMVGLGSDVLDRYPRSFSGGQRQRIAIARALAVGPRLLVCDEPVSALDVSVQAQVLNLLQDMQQQLDLAILFIAHDLAVVRHLCDRIAVMKGGELVEIADRRRLYESPQHPYTQALLASIPVPDPPVERRRRSARKADA